MSSDLTIARINAMGREAFVAALGFVFELSPWVVERTHARAPFADRETLLTAMTQTLDAAPEADKLTLIRAHPELAGKAARAGELTRESFSEQTAAGLSALTEREFESFHALNTAYRARFDFPFIICARLNDKTSILAAMARRLAHERADELRAALAEIVLIARLRLFDAVVS